MSEPEHPEIQWIHAYRKGDTAALGCLVEHYRKPLYAFIYNMIQGQGDAEEIFQEVWLRAIRNLAGFKQKNFIGWLFRIAHNYFIDQVRKSRNQTIPFPEGDGNPDTPFIERFASGDHGPDRQVAARDLGERIEAALASLPGDQRETFLMRTEGDLSFKEIARIQGISLNTALSRMHYAVQKLRPLLQEEYELLSKESRHEPISVR